MFRLAAILLTCFLAKSSLGHLAYTAPLVAADPAFVPSASSQYIARNYNAIAAPILQYSSVSIPVAYSAASTVNSFTRFGAPFFAAPVTDGRFIAPLATASLVRGAPGIPVTPVTSAEPVFRALQAAPSDPVLSTTQLIRSSPAASIVPATPVIATARAAPVTLPIAGVRTSAPVFTAARTATAPIAFPASVPAARVAVASAPFTFTTSIAAPLAYTAKYTTAYATPFAAPFVADSPPIAYSGLTPTFAAQSVLSPLAANPFAYSAPYLPTTLASTPAPVVASRTAPSPAPETRTAEDRPTENNAPEAPAPLSPAAGTQFGFNAAFPGAVTYGSPASNSAPEPSQPETPFNPQESNSFDSETSLADGRNQEPAEEGVSIYAAPEARPSDQQSQGSFRRSDSSPARLPLKYTLTNGRA